MPRRKIERAARRALLALACALAAVPVSAQVDPRLTGAAVIAQLEAATHELSARAGGAPAELAAAADKLAKLTDALRRKLGNDAGQRVEKLGDEPQAMALRAFGAAQQTQAFLAAADGCLDGDLAAMARALDASLAKIAAAPESSKAAQPAIYAIESADHRALFAVQADTRDTAIALTGVNLHDAQCSDPLVTVTDAAGAPLSWQPTLTGALPNRIELKLPSALAAGTVLFHVAPKRKARLLGCSAQPEAAVALTVAPPMKIAVEYTVSGVCRVARGKKAVLAEEPIAAVSGRLPELSAYGATVSKAIDLAACDDPVSYTITAKASFADGSSASVGPITQSAAAGITAGLPGGLSLSWDPSVKALFARAGAKACRGFY